MPQSISPAFLTRSSRPGGGQSVPPRSSLLTPSDGAYRRRFVNRLAVLVLAAAAAGLVDDGVAWRRLVADHHTDVARREEVVIDPQTRLLLNTRTSLDVGGQPDAREIRLLDGEILLRQGLGAHPLVVRTPHGRILSSDARLAISRLGDSTVLSVLHGSAQVRAAGGSGAARQVPAGQRMVIGPQGAGELQPVQEADVAWINGEIVVHALKPVAQGGAPERVMN